MINAAELATQSDLFVVGSGDDGALRRFLVGSSSDALNGHVTAPTIVIPAGARARPVHGRVVVGVDGSEESARAAKWAKDESTARGWELVVIHIWHLPVVLASPLAPTIGVPQAEYEQAAGEILGRAVGELGANADATRLSRLVHGNVDHELVEAAAEADLLVVGTRGHGALVSKLIGSTSRYCVHHSPCAVAVIP